MSASVRTNPEGFRIRGWHVAVAFCSFFAVVIAVDAAFLTLAYRSHPGEVSVTPYEDGRLYNRRIAQVEAQARRGWRATAAAGPGSVVLQIADRAGRPVRGLALTGRLERPATEAGRIAIRFVETTPGRYAATTGAVSGAWDLTAEALGENAPTFTAERRLTWP